MAAPKNPPALPLAHHPSPGNSRQETITESFIPVQIFLEWLFQAGNGAEARDDGEEGEGIPWGGSGLGHRDGSFFWEAQTLPKSRIPLDSYQL